MVLLDSLDLSRRVEQVDTYEAEAHIAPHIDSGVSAFPLYHREEDSQLM